jgi:hypothetical protein
LPASEIPMPSRRPLSNAVKGCRPFTKWVWVVVLGATLTGCGGQGQSSTSAQQTPASQTLTHSVLVSWNTGVGQVSGYVVYRSSDPTGPFLPMALTLSGINQYTDGSVVVGQTYYYLVTSYDSTNEQSLPSSIVSATAE